VMTGMMFMAGSLMLGINIVTYSGVLFMMEVYFHSKTQQTTVKCDQPFSKHMSGVYTQRCPTQDSFYRTSSGNLPTQTHILAVRKSPNTPGQSIVHCYNSRASLAGSRYELTLQTNRSP
jgi:hypothetical protein